MDKNIYPECSDIPNATEQVCRELIMTTVARYIGNSKCFDLKNQFS